MTAARGLTFLEVVISIALLGILLAVGSNMISDSVVASKVATADSQALSAAHIATERMTREIREVRVQGKGYRVLTMQPNELVFEKNVQGTVQTVSIALAQNELLLNGSSMITNVSAGLPGETGAVLFGYYTAAEQPTTSVTTVRQVRFTFTHQPLDSPAVAMHSSVALRNLK